MSSGKCLSLFNSLRDKEPKVHQVSSIGQWLHQNRGGRDKSQTALVGLYKLKGGTTRASHNVETVYAFGVDLDCGVSQKEINERLSGYNYYLYHTFSSTPSHNRMRVIFPLTRGVSPEEFQVLFKFFRVIIPELDRACSDPGRIFYLPGQSERIYGYNGKAFNPDEIIEHMQGIIDKEVELKEIKESKYVEPDLLDFENVASALMRCDPDMDYSDWYRIAMVLKGELGDREDVFQLFNEWSKRGTKYPGIREIIKFWRRLPEPSGALSIGTLFEFSRRK